MHDNNFPELPEVFNIDSTFLCDEEIVEHLKETLSKEDIQILLEHKQSDLIALHHSLGQHIRNTYGLWYPHYPYMPDGSNADDFSFSIIQMLYKELNDEA